MAATSAPRKQQAADVAAWLDSGQALPGDGSVRRVDTHAAMIFLKGDRAWKLKRPVNLGYLDFSTPGRRRKALEAELRLNRRTAPGLYRAVHPVTRDMHGQLRIGGPGAPVDWLLEMTRFPDEALLASMADRGALDDDLLLRLADGIVAFHADAAVCPSDDGAGPIRAVIEGNARSFARVSDVLDEGKARALTQRLLAAVERHTALLDARASAGRIRHCHGDLHLANIALLDGIPTPFDCLEFDPALATTDILYDLAFLLMDLWERGLRHAANLVLNRYLDLSAQDEPGIGLIPLFMAVRASIRAHVLAAQYAQHPDAEGRAARARRYLDLATALAAPTPPRLVAIGGLSGTGKSTLARSVGGEIGGAPGARILRSDVLRKRLAGVRPDVRLPASAYGAGTGAPVHAEIARLAEASLATGISVIADATFMQPADRSAISAMTARQGCRFDGLWLHAPDAERIHRVDHRPPDASDADAAVARAQSDRHLPQPSDWAIVETGGPFDALRARALALLMA
ncbi:AAA family ATPase [Sphingobium aquiterrae]|uniref:bifunctional aminoglycoside phosphotransferase/ATP-binding protein n=1 Tax=Sphingobium aquiterrae TaxID=2038656 RepID=UPI00301879B9